MRQPKCIFDCLPRAYERPCGSVPDTAPGASPPSYFIPKAAPATTPVIWAPFLRATVRENQHQRALRNGETRRHVRRICVSDTLARSGPRTLAPGTRAVVCVVPGQAVPDCVFCRHSGDFGAFGSIYRRPVMVSIRLIRETWKRCREQPSSLRFICRWLTTAILPAHETIEPCLGQLHSFPSVLSVNTPVGASSWGAMFTAWLSVSIG